MKFFIEINNRPQQRILTYVVEEYSFDISPIVKEIDFDLVINNLNLTVADKKVIQVWGLCPYSSWIKANYSVPNFKKGTLKVIDDLKPGFSYGLNDVEWPIYVNHQTGWVCIGNPEKSGKAVEFINNCVAVFDDNGELMSLWLRPKKPKNKNQYFKSEAIHGICNSVNG